MEKKKVLMKKEQGSIQEKKNACLVTPMQRM